MRSSRSTYRIWLRPVRAGISAKGGEGCSRQVRWQSKITAQRDDVADPFVPVVARNLENLLA